MSLHPTKHRRALLKAITEPGRIYLEAGQVWDAAAGGMVTARVRELVHTGWVVTADPHGPRRPGEFSFRVYYRLTDLGESTLEGGAR